MRLRLLHCKQPPEDGHITVSFEEYDGDLIPPYAILSHRWGPAKDEVSFYDINSGSARLKKGYAKVQGCCTQALEDGFSYIWIDSCCIDKSSSAELSESINSMYCYYAHAAVCYAYLEDDRNKESAFRSSEWFRRGWTLQELIAPKAVIFLSHDWIELGTRATLADVVEEVTGIERKFLTGHSVLDASIAKRMSWAARRTTTRIEDRAYSLMGLFGVNMPAIYGEGHKAFTRLQLEILKTSTDQTIFAWDDSGVERCGMLADHVYRFRNGSTIEQLEPHELISYGNISSYRPASLRFHYELTNFGLHIWLPMQHILRGSRAPLVRAALSCRDTSSQSPRSPVFINLMPTEESSKLPHYVRTGKLPNFNSKTESHKTLQFRELFITEPAYWSAVHSGSSKIYRPYERLEVHFHALQGFILLDHYPQSASTMQSPFLLPAGNGQQFTLQFWKESTTEMLLIYGKLDMNGAWLHLAIASIQRHPRNAKNYHQSFHSRTENSYRRTEELWSQVDLPLSKALAIMSAKDLEHPQTPGLSVFRRLRVNLRTVPPARALL